MKGLRAARHNYVARHNRGTLQTPRFMIFDSNNDVLIVNQLCIPYDLFICLWLPSNINIDLVVGDTFTTHQKVAS
jgi:hypothetical protein